MPALRAILTTFLLGLRIAAVAVPTVAAAAPAINNTATLTYSDDGAPRVVASNTTSLDVLEFIKRPTTLGFRQLPPGYRFGDTPCPTAASAELNAGPFTSEQLSAARPLASLVADDPFVLVLEALGEDRDPNLRDATSIRLAVGGKETSIRLLETAPSSGIFAGAIAPRGSAAGDCAVDLSRQGAVDLSFNESDRSLPSRSQLLLDPTNYVFDSRTGKPVDGVSITLIDTATGAPATQILGEDGTSSFPATVVSGGTVTDSGQKQYAFTAGNFRFPLAAPGRYRLKIDPPSGYTSPSKASESALATLSGPRGDYLVVAGSYGREFDIADRAPVRADVPIDPASTATLLLEKSASIREASPGDFIQYRLQLTNRGTGSAGRVTIDDTLPVSLRYKTGSSRANGQKLAEPRVGGNGRALTFDVPSVPSAGGVQITYVVEVAPGAPAGEAISHAIARGAATSNEAVASVRLRPLLLTDAMTIIGRLTEGDCGSPGSGRKGVPGIRLLLEDGTFTVTDRDGLYHFEGARPGSHVVQIDTRSIPVTHEPVACDLDTRQGRSAISRFVEGGGGSISRVDFQLRPTGKVADALADLPVTVDSDATAAGNRTDWLATASAEPAWLFPAADHNPRAPALRVVIQHRADQRVALTINGVVSDPLLFDGTDTDTPRGVAVSRWSGLPLGDRDNVLVARILDASGKVVTTLNRTVHYANAPTRILYVPEKSRLAADGLTAPLVAVKVLDRDGRPVRTGTIIPFRVDQPYVAAQEIAAEQGRQLAGLDRTLATARVVGDDGLAFIALQPTTQAGLAAITITLRQDGVDQVSTIKPWLSAAQQDWMVVGFGKGTVGYDILKSKARPLAGRRRDVITDGQLAFYAKGQIKGSWLLTIAYDSDKKQDRDRRLLGTIDPDRYYTVYGDGSAQGYDAPTRRKLYLRLERRNFYALFGDFESGLTETRLTRYSRTVNGVKAEYRDEKIAFNAFAANDDQLYARDEIQGNGLSGPYRLSAGEIVANSDKISIETRDRFRSEKIVETRQLTRHIDYDIDASAATIRFREPILHRDSDLNPIFIVVDYETYGRSHKTSAGGRASVRLLDRKVEIGASLIRDETVSRATVAGVDLKAQIDRNTVLRGEAASGGRQGFGEGRAFLSEIEHHGGRADVLAYAQRQDRTFGLGQQNIGQAGTTKYGVDGRLRLTDRLSLTGIGWYQLDLDSAARRGAGEAKLEYRRDNGTLFVGAQVAADRTVEGEKRNSRLISLGGTRSLLGDKLGVTGQTQFALGGADDSIDFPVRHLLQLSYRLKPSIRIIAGREIARGDKFTARNDRVGVDLSPRSGTHILTTLNQQAIGENGARTFAQYGLTQSIPLGKNWTIDGTIDASKTIRGEIPTSDIINPFHPVTSGGSIGGQTGRQQLEGDYRAVTLGASYRTALWSANGRLEYSDGDLADRKGFTGNLLRTLGEGKTIASSIQFYSIREETGATTSYAAGDVALALRPLDSRWSLLERFQLRHERADRGASTGNALAVPVFADGDQTTSRAINNLAVNYRTGQEGNGHGVEASVYYGAKYVRGRYADEAYDGFIDVVGMEIRKDLSRRLDIGVNGSVQHSWTGRTAAFSVGPSIGFSPAANSWLSLGYNVTGFRDRDFEEARYTRQGPYVTMRVKFDQLSLRAAHAGKENR